MDEILRYERAGTVLLDPFGSLLSLLILVFIGIAVANTRLSQPLKNLIYVALALRLVGSLARYSVLFGLYRGSGDARGYYSRGLSYAEGFWRLDFSPLYDPAYWAGGKWYGTQFVYFPSALVHGLIGPSMPGGFLMFSLLAFVGLAGFAVAFSRTYPEVPVTRYARWLWLFPALWYWPSSIGKEAIVLLGLGLTIMGYVGRHDRVNWLLLVVGLFLVFGIRPQVAAVVILSLIIAHWLSLIRDRWTLGTTVQAAVLMGGGLVGIYVALQFAGVESLGVEGVQEYMEDNKGRALGGDSRVEPADVSITGIPVALMNILLRPFPWEAHNLMAMISAIEIAGFWTIAWFRRHSLVNALRYWRHDRMLRVAVPFIVVYSITLGMVVANMGLIARQRIFLFPFLFLLIEAVPRVAAARRRVPPGAGERGGGGAGRRRYAGAAGVRA
jgi:hypothetical protein